MPKELHFRRRWLSLGRFGMVPPPESDLSNPPYNAVTAPTFILGSGKSFTVKDHNGTAILTLADGSPDTAVVNPLLTVVAGTDITTTNVDILHAGSTGVVLLKSVNGDGDLRYQGPSQIYIIPAGNLILGTNGGIIIAGAKLSSYNSIATTGLGVPAIYGATKQKSETGAADANVLTLTPPAKAGTYHVKVIANVASATNGVVEFTLTYQDSNGNAVSATTIPLQKAGTAAPANSFTVASGITQINGFDDIDIDNSATPIVIAWVGGGTIAAKVSAEIWQSQ